MNLSKPERCVLLIHRCGGIRLASCIFPSRSAMGGFVLPHTFHRFTLYIATAVQPGVMPDDIPTNS